MPDGSLDYGMGTNDTTGTNLRIGFDYGKRPDHNTFVQRSTFSNISSGMNSWFHN